MENNQQFTTPPSRARLPYELDQIVASHANQRMHPILVQGRFFGVWPVPAAPNGDAADGWKAITLQKQAANLRQFFTEHAAEWTSLRARMTARCTKNGFSERVVCSSRLVNGFGIANPVETNLLLHPLYGIPYLPGSALKGVCQNYLLLRWAAAIGVPILTKEEQDRDAKSLLACFEALLLGGHDDKLWKRGSDALQAALGEWGSLTALPPAQSTAAQQQVLNWVNSPQAREQASVYSALFGLQDRQGRVVFFDSFPETLNIAVDVLTPHYSNSYGNPAVPPADSQQPIPTAFLVVDIGSVFQIGLCGLTDRDRDLAAFARDCLLAALRYRGIGAKTNSGYGRFESAA